MLPTAAPGRAEVRSPGPLSFQQMIRVTWGEEKERKEKVHFTLWCRKEKKNPKKNRLGSCYWQEEIPGGALYPPLTPRSDLLTETYVLLTDLWHGFDSGKCDQFFLIIDSIINEKSTVDVTASACRPLLTVKGFHTHSHFHTAEGNTGQWAENPSAPGLLGRPHSRCHH